MARRALWNRLPWLPTMLLPTPVRANALVDGAGQALVEALWQRASQRAQFEVCYMHDTPPSRSPQIRVGVARTVPVCQGTTLIEEEPIHAAVVPREQEWQVTHVLRDVAIKADEDRQRSGALLGHLSRDHDSVASYSIRTTSKEVSNHAALSAHDRVAWGERMGRGVLDELGSDSHLPKTA